MQCAILFAFVTIASAIDNSQFLDIERTVYDDRSALTNKNNLKSKAYQDFIHTLYRRDEDNLKRVDNLFQQPERPRPYYQPLTNYAQEPAQPTYATYLAQQQQYRQKRDVVMRPRFVYRHFADRKREDAQDRALRRKAFHQRQQRLQNHNGALQ